MVRRKIGEGNAIYLVDSQLLKTHTQGKPRPEPSGEWKLGLKARIEASVAAGIAKEVKAGLSKELVVESVTDIGRQ
jgi:hypothetical protein